jgi:hypothetical protein
MVVRQQSKLDFNRCSSFRQYLRRKKGMMTVRRSALHDAIH